MSEAFIGEIRMFAGNFAPRNWAFCDGQLLAISGNDALFSLLGTVYGGDGRTTFALPDLRGRIPIHKGLGPGLSSRAIGSKAGNETANTSTNTLPVHSHTAQASTQIGSELSPQNEVLCESPSLTMFRVSSPTAPLASNAVTAVGGNSQHTNMMPFLAIHFIIALFGVFPSRN